jgi:histidine triad (HIT) family protein
MDDCLFCKLVRGEAKSWKVAENAHVYAFLDVNPASEYHTLVIPKRHFESIFDLPKEELNLVMDVVKDLTSQYRDKLGIDNVQIINSSGSEAQQDVFHVHFHIVPRKLGDGQNVRWTTHPEWQERFDEMLDKLND